MKRLLALGTWISIGIVSIFAQEPYPAFDTAASYTFDSFTPQLDSTLESGYYFQNDQKGFRVSTVELAAFPPGSFNDSVSKAVHYPNALGLDTLFVRTEKNADGSGWHLGYTKQTSYSTNGELRSSVTKSYGNFPPFPLLRQQHEESDSLGNYLFYELKNLITGPDTVELTRIEWNGNIQTRTDKSEDLFTKIFETRSIITTEFNNDGLPVWKKLIFKVSGALANTDSIVYQYDSQGREISSESFTWTPAFGGKWQNSTQSTTTYDLNADTISYQTILFYLSNSWRPYREFITHQLSLPSGKEISTDLYVWLGSSYYWSRRVTKTYDSRDRLVKDYFYADWNHDKTSIGRDYREFTYFDTTDIIRTEVFWISDDWAPYQKQTATYNSLDDLGNIGIDNFQLLAFRAFPNPSSDMVELILPSAAPALIQLMDIQGRVVLREESIGTNPTMSVNGLPAGAYVLQLQQGNRLGRTTLMVR